MAVGVALEDMAIGAVAIDRLVAAEQTMNLVAATLGRNAGLLIQANGCKYGHKRMEKISTYACCEVGFYIWNGHRPRFNDGSRSCSREDRKNESGELGERRK